MNPSTAASHARNAALVTSAVYCGRTAVRVVRSDAVVVFVVLTLTHRYNAVRGHSTDSNVVRVRAVTPCLWVVHSKDPSPCTVYKHDGVYHTSPP